MRARLPAAVLLTVALLAPATAGAHVERPSQFPEEPGEVPTYRKGGPKLLVCKRKATVRRIEKLPKKAERRNERLYERCREDGFRHIQAAVDHVKRQGTRILVLPGVYRERPWAGAPGEGCRGLENGRPLSYEDQRRCPGVDNLISIFGDSDDPDRVCDLAVCRLQIEGTGKRPTDVIVDNNWHKLNAIRADRADGVYLRNFTVQEAEFNAVYILETDGFVIDRMLGRWNFEYGFLTFSSDHGLYRNCEAYGNGDSGLYPGSAADLHGVRPSIEITGCDSHHNTLGYSGTAGNSTFVHHNTFHHNTLGAVMDSFFPDHPGLPQDSAHFVENEIFTNNQDYYRYYRDGTCNRPFREIDWKSGVVCPAIPVPIGVGVMLAGGNTNLYERNWIWDNWRYGTMQFGVPASFRNEPEKGFDTSHGNTYRGNLMGISPSGPAPRNGVDHWWDGQGEGNCWEGNQPAPGRGLTSEPPVLPGCDPRMPGTPVSPVQATIASCAFSDPRDPDTYAICDWYTAPPQPD